MVTQALSLLETRGLVRVLTDQIKPTVRVKHALIREAIYNSILQSRRMELHYVTAQTLTALYPQPDLELVLTIADQWQRAGQDEHALNALLPYTQNLIYTGRSAWLTEVLARLNRAMLSDAQLRALDLARADAHAARGEYEPARALYEQLLAQTHTHELRARLLQSLGVAAYHLGIWADALEFYRAGLELAQAQGDIALQAKTNGGLGLVYLALGETARAEQFLLQSRDTSLQLGDSLELAAAEYNLGGARRLLGQYEKAIQCATRAREIYTKLGYATALARTQQMLGACYHSMGDFAQAAEHYSRAIAESNRLGDLMAIAITQSNLAELYAEQLDLDKAIQLYDLSSQYFRSTRQESSLAYNLAGLAHAQVLAAGRAKDSAFLDSATQNIHAALQIAQRIQSLELEGIAYRVLAESLMEQNKSAQAQEYAQRSITLLTQVGSALEAERARHTHAKISQIADRETHTASTVFQERTPKG